MSQTRLQGRQRRVIGTAGATRAASGGLLATALVVFVGREGSLFAVGMLATVFHLSTMVFSPLWGTLGDVTGRRQHLLVGISSVTTVIAFSFIFVDGVWSFVGLRGVYAVFVVGYGTLMLSLVGALGGTDHRGQATGFFKSATAVGNVVAKVLVGVFLVLLTPSELFLVVGVLSLVATGLLVKVEDPFSPSQAPVTVRSLAENIRARLIPAATERAHLHRTGLTWLYGGLAIRHMAVKGVGSLVPIYLLSQVGVSEIVMGGLLAIGPGVQVVVNPYFGRVVDQRSSKRIIVLGMAGSGAYAVVLAAASFPIGSLLQIAAAASSFVLIATGFSAMDLGVLGFIGDSVPPARESEFIGLRSTAAGVGGVIGPTIVGATATFAGYQIAFTLMGLLAFIAAFLTARTLTEPERNARASETHREIETWPDLTRLPGGDATREHHPDEH